MPIYEFECESCHKITEVVQSISAPPLSHCPECNGSVKKLISQSSFQLKGGGWYADGYSSPSKKETAPEKPAKQECSKAKNGTCPCAKTATA
jgi:putative FmdB family regulatory protein